MLPQQKLAGWPDVVALLSSIKHDCSNFLSAAQPQLNRTWRASSSLQCLSRLLSLLQPTAAGACLAKT